MVAVNGVAMESGGLPYGFCDIGSAIDIVYVQELFTEHILSVLGTGRADYTQDQRGM